MLAIIFVLGAKAPRSAGCIGSAQAQHGIIHVFLEASQAGKISLATSKIYLQNRSTVIWFSELPSCPRFSARDKSHISKKTWGVRSDWDRWHPFGVSGIGVSGNRKLFVHCN
jgi:hypothetical protein